MLKQIARYANTCGNVVVFRDIDVFSVKYELERVPGLYHVRVRNVATYEDALKHFNHYKGALKRAETKRMMKII